jgi:hypothetical protein
MNAQSFINLVLTSGATAGGANNYNYVIDVFAEFDMIVIIEQGVAKVVA